MSLYLQRILSRPYHSTNPIKSFKLPFSFIPHTLIDNHTHIIRSAHHTCVHNNCNDDIVHNMSCLCHLKVTGRAWEGRVQCAAVLTARRLQELSAPAPELCRKYVNCVPDTTFGLFATGRNNTNIKTHITEQPRDIRTRARQAANCTRARVASTAPGLGRNIGRGEQGCDIRLSSQYICTG